MRFKIYDKDNCNQNRIQLIEIENNYNRKIMISRYFDEKLFKQLNLLKDEKCWFNFVDDVNYMELILKKEA
ncbi:hypothetical protein QE109_05100 [Fusibacter bizertensis]|uniref:Uncharacterized protein n=1 Tax=Fusibacter bizertensis TaxID=1488331 RepID=A0ABT6NAR9_9FIRM|nr:hypothetical protein [Fusibacter bizertensis]MDH8677512.1 hypothetical protein [Fusibacter bizertensis]